MSIVIRNDQSVSFALGFEDKYGNVVTEVGSTPVWSLSDDAVAALQVSEDGLSATVTPTAGRGSVLLSVVVDADPDEDYEELVGQAEIAIVAGKASVVRLSGVISDIVAAEPAPVEPTPEPAPEPAPVEPSPTEPAPEPVPVEPAPVEPTEGGVEQGGEGEQQ